MTEGTIFSINISPSRVPKSPTGDAIVTVKNHYGNSERNCKLHDRPERPVWIYAIERILALREEGHRSLTRSSPGCRGSIFPVAVRYTPGHSRRLVRIGDRAGLT